MTLFHAGDTIINGHQPFVYAVCPEYTVDYCSYCLQPIHPNDNCEESVLSCPQCRFSRYCSAQCWEYGSKDHEYICTLVTSLPDNTEIQTDLLLLAKILRKLEYGNFYDASENINSCPKPNKQPRSFFDLISHKQEIHKDVSRMAELETWYTTVADVLEPSLEHVLAFTCTNQNLSLTRPKREVTFGDPFDLFVDIMGKLQCNAFSILDGFLNKVAEGLYLEASVFDHACGSARNAHYFFDGTGLYVKAFKDIQSFSDVRISYVDCFVPPLIRQHKLQNRYYFACRCRMCADPETVSEIFAIKCGTPGCGGTVPLPGLANADHDDNVSSKGEILKDKRSDQEVVLTEKNLVACSKCQLCPTLSMVLESRALTEDHLLMHTEICLSSEDADADKKLFSTETGSFAENRRHLECYEMMLADEIDLLHSTNFLRGLTFEAAGRWYLALPHSRPNTVKALEYLLESLKAQRKFFSKNDPTIALLLIDIADLQKQCDQTQSASATMEEARDILNTVENRDSPCLSLASKILQDLH
ncbi:uncharacterized protein LOC129597314 [Paramacrobiotus metropolitanus]|uniref:uncharacterized protein LOC129597314 n=1 Tax=Paramacrobiotus metropolitanus TaxID=2943436 RepID=UPI0024460E98|nr:uncharacterized protein LOC129597314 [Paramacrobiotus metropolitanus]XP_055350781.1 uncharacterized protein LOC129597314 [Paramacrobiotus metropolitanus]